MEPPNHNYSPLKAAVQAKQSESEWGLPQQESCGSSFENSITQSAHHSGVSTSKFGEDPPSGSFEVNSASPIHTDKSKSERLPATSSSSSESTAKDTKRNSSYTSSPYNKTSESNYSTDHRTEQRILKFILMDLNATCTSFGNKHVILRNDKPQSPEGWRQLMVKMRLFGQYEITFIIGTRDINLKFTVTHRDNPDVRTNKDKLDVYHFERERGKKTPSYTLCHPCHVWVGVREGFPVHLIGVDKTGLVPRHYL